VAKGEAMEITSPDKILLRRMRSTKGAFMLAIGSGAGFGNLTAACTARAVRIANVSKQLWHASRAGSMALIAARTSGVTQRMTGIGDYSGLRRSIRYGAYLATNLRLVTSASFTTLSGAAAYKGLKCRRSCDSSAKQSGEPGGPPLHHSPLRISSCRSAGLAQASRRSVYLHGRGADR